MEFSAYVDRMDRFERGTRRFFGLGRSMPHGGVSWSARRTPLRRIRALFGPRRPIFAVRLRPED
jgi:hypothetical protein